MFPASYQTVGYIPAGTQVSDPANDPQLLSETESHYWFQFDSGSGMQDADPLMPGATIGQTFTTATGTFTEVPDALRQTTTIQLIAEMTGALSGPQDTTVLNQTFNDVDLVGRPLTIGNFVSTYSPPSLFISVTTNTYSPYIDIGDEAYPDGSHDEVIQGTPYQEVLTNFPLASQILTGLFLNITLSGPQASPVTYEKTLVDRIGFAARQGSGTIALPPINPTGQSILTNNDLWTVNVLPGLQSPAVIGGQLDVLNKLEAQLNALLPTINAIPSTGPQTPEQQAALTQTGSLNQQIALLSNAALTIEFARASDRATAQLETGYNTLSYYTSPRLLVASTQQDGSSLSAAIDLMKDDARDIEDPGQAVGVSFFFEQMRGYFESELEGQVLEAATGQPSITFDAVTEALGAQGGQLVIITQDNLNQLDGLSLSADAKARIAQEVNAGFGVLTPTQMVMINGQSTVEWLEVNFATGQLISVAPDGSHQALTEFSAALDNPLNVATAGFIGTMDGFAVSQITFMGDILSGIANGKDLADVVRDAKVELFTDLAEDYTKLLVSAIPVPETESEWEALGAEIAKSILGLAVGPDLFRKPLDPLDVGNEVVRLILGKTVPGFSNLSLAFDAGLVAGSAFGIYYIATNFPGDPPLFPALTTELASLTPANFATGTVTVAASLSPPSLSSTVNTGTLTVSNQLVASWTSSAVSGFQVSSLSASGATVTDASGTVVGSGAVALAEAAPIGAAVSGNDQYNVNGTGSLSFYGPAGTQLGVSGSWTSYSATVSGTVSITLTTGGLSLNDTTLPAGTYTITTSSATLSGSGTTSSPNFAGSASITATGGTINLGPGSGSLAVGGTPLDPEDETTLDGYNGTISVSANGDGTDLVNLSGNAGNVLQVSVNPTTFTTDQNTPITFQPSIQTSLADTYNLTANAPLGWRVTIDSNGNVTATPAPGLQGGTYPIQIIAQSQTDPNLEAQTTVDVTITPTQPGMTLAVNPDPIFTVPYDGAQLPTAFRAVIQNLGPAADTYNLTFSNIPSGFTLLESATSDTVPA
ncbi:MAG TPA: hypothetical protein VKA15_14520, partial [Isosphaeraceae bacterium]|nr:hypothetical protein [Isosphaeraceae bacterium]